MPAQSLLDEVGLSFELARMLATKNDEGASFVEIAKIVRELSE